MEITATTTNNQGATEVTLTAIEFYTYEVCQIEEENLWGLTHEKAVEIATAFVDEFVGEGAKDVIISKKCPKAVLTGFIREYISVPHGTQD